MPSRLTATVLVENTAPDGLSAEHGLSLHIRYRQPDSHELQLLLDFGQTDAFARNAQALGIDLACVNTAVLSHAHYDHADGMSTFLAANETAPLYLSEACAEDCWSTKSGTTEPHYIGIRLGTLTNSHERLESAPIERTTTIAPGVHLVPHTTPGLGELGRHAGMLRHKGDIWIADDFAHELSLVFELDDKRIAIFSSCSHAGLPAITAEVASSFPDWRIAAYVGGLHLVHATDDEVLAVAQAIRNAGIEQLYTGHCTGSHACELLTDALPTQMTKLRTGLTLHLK